MFTGAGILFTDKINGILAGFHPTRGLWSGIGGKCEEGEVPYQTALRECAEEIFGVEPEVHVIEEMQTALRLKFPIPSGDYAVYRASLYDLFTLSLILEKNGYSSKYYSSFPTSVWMLLQDRVTPAESEITTLSLFTLEEKDALRATFTPEFYEDLSFLEPAFYKDNPSN